MKNVYVHTETSLHMVTIESAILYSIFTQHRSVVERWMFSEASLCLWVCLCVKTITSERVHMMMKLGGRCIAQKSQPSSHLGVIAPRRGV